jgi:predicted nuclease of predicted toxin-antitoxin system
MRTQDRFLADENFPMHVIQWLRQIGHDVLAASDALVGSSDIELLRLAQEQNRVFLTFDGDFGDLVFRRRLQASVGVVLFRMKHLPSSLRRIVVTAFFQTEPEVRGFFTVVSPGRYRKIRISE